MGEKRSAVEYLNGIGGGVTALTVVIIAIASLNDAMRKYRDARWNFPAPVWWTLSVILALVAAAMTMRFIGTRARLLRRDVLHLRPNDVAHLKGREEDIELLLAACRDSPQVNVIGESGAGKTALMQSGILPRADTIGMIALYVNSWGRHWEDGPRHAIAQAIQSEPRLNVVSRDLAAAAEAAGSEGKQLLVVFDQFDDYQNTHFARFRSPETRTLISDHDLVELNPFWREVRDLLAGGSIHCVFVTRADAAAGLDVVRFAQPRIYPLDRLRREAAYELFDTLLTPTGADQQPIIASQNNGWPALRERLVRDLNEEGSVLPIQMKLALKGLSSLSYLTVREYERGGGLQGLEAADVAWHVRQAANRANVPEGQILAILIDLVDREAHKTRVRRLSDIVASTTLPPKTIQSVLAEWEAKDLVRIQPDVDEPGWTLDHDYLSNSVLAAESRANRAAVMLRDSEADFRASGRNALRRWRTLLSPLQQFDLWRERSKGRFRYTEKQKFALLSLVRFIPYIAGAVLFAFIARNQVEISHENHARDLVGQIGVDDSEMTGNEVNVFWAVAQAPLHSRLHFLKAALSSEANSAQLQRRSAVAMTAVSGIDATAREQIIPIFLKKIYDTRSDQLTRSTAVTCLARLDALDINGLIAAMSGANGVLFDPEYIPPSDRAWNEHFARLTTEQADVVAAAAMDRLPPGSTLSTTGAKNSIAMLTHVLPHCSSAFVTGAVRRVLGMEDNYQLIEHANALSVANLAPDQRAQIRSRIQVLLRQPSLPLSVENVAQRYGIPVDQATLDRIALTQALSPPHRLFKGDATPLNRISRLLTGDETREFFSAGTKYQLIGAVLAKLDPSQLNQIVPVFGNWASQQNFSELEKLNNLLTPDRAEAFRVPQIAREHFASVITAASFRSVEGLPLIKDRETRRLVISKAAYLAKSATQLDDLESLTAVVDAQGGDSRALTERLRAELGSPDIERREGAKSIMAAVKRVFGVPLPIATQSNLLSILSKVFDRASKKNARAEAAEALVEIGHMESLFEKQRIALVRKDLDAVDDDIFDRPKVTIAELLSAAPERLDLITAKKVVAALLKDEKTDQAINLCRTHRDRNVLIQHVEEVLDSAESASLAGAAASVLLADADTAMQSFIDVLKKPTCSAPCTGIVLKLMERSTAMKFEGNRWYAAEWAARQKLDVSTPPQKAAVTHSRTAATVRANTMAP